MLAGSLLISQVAGSTGGRTFRRLEEKKSASLPGPEMAHLDGARVKSILVQRRGESGGILASLASLLRLAESRWAGGRTLIDPKRLRAWLRRRKQQKWGRKRKEKRQKSVGCRNSREPIKRTRAGRMHFWWARSAGRRPTVKRSIPVRAGFGRGSMHFRL